MTITGGSGLGKDEIDRMVKEAEAHEAEDKKRKEDAETRNQAESFAYQTEKLVNDNKDKLSDDVPRKSPISQRAQEALKGEDIEKIKSAQSELMTSAQKIGPGPLRTAGCRRCRRRRRCRRCCRFRSR